MDDMELAEAKALVGEASQPYVDEYTAMVLTAHLINRLERLERVIVFEVVPLLQRIAGS